MEPIPRKLTDEEVVGKFQKAVDEGRLDQDIIDTVREALQIAREANSSEQSASQDGIES